MENQHMTQKVFAKFIGISESTLSSVFNGKTNPTVQMIDAIHQHLPKVSTNWLMWGEGNMYSDQSTAAPSQSAPATKGSDNTPEGNETSPAPSLFDALREGQQDGVARTPKNIEQTIVKYIDKPQRKITEIRIFFDDQTWETFLPSK